MLSRFEKNVIDFEIPGIFENILNNNTYTIDLSEEANDDYVVSIPTMSQILNMYKWKEKRSPFDGGIINMSSCKKENKYIIENERLMELLKTEQDKVYSLIQEIINYRSKVCNEDKKTIVMDLYKKELISGSIVKAVLEINHYELLELIGQYKVDYKVEYDEEEKENNLEFLRGLL